MFFLIFASGAARFQLIDGVLSLITAYRSFAVGVLIRKLLRDEVTLASVRLEVWIFWFGKVHELFFGKGR